VAVPWVGAILWGKLYVNIYVAQAGLTLTGYLLETRLEIIGTLHFDKFPIQIA
jgi:hypothetical protein